MYTNAHSIINYSLASFTSESGNKILNKIIEYSIRLYRISTVKGKHSGSVAIVIVASFSQ
jgi:hypothetical protein